MSETAPQTELHIPTLQEVYAYADGTYTDEKGSMYSGNREKLEEFCQSAVEILGQLSGQAKVNYFHSVFFLHDFDQKMVWSALAEHDDDASIWHDSLRLQKEIQGRGTTDEQNIWVDRTRDVEWAAHNLYRAGVKKVEAHPATERSGQHYTVAAFSGKLGLTDVDFRLVVADAPKLKYPPMLTIELPDEPQPFSSGDFDQKKYVSHENTDEVIFRPEEGQAYAKFGELYQIDPGPLYHSLVSTPQGPSVTLYRKQIIDVAEPLHDSFEALREHPNGSTYTILTGGSLPLQSEADTGLPVGLHMASSYFESGEPAPIPRHQIRKLLKMVEGGIPQL